MENLVDFALKQKYLWIFGMLAGGYGGYRSFGLNYSSGSSEWQKAFENMKKTLEHGVVKNAEFALVHKNGYEFPAELSASVVRDCSGNPTGFVVVTRDITERKMIEQRLFRSERLAAIGELAGMIGHDLRNPLTGIAGATYYLKTKLSGVSDSKIKEMLRIIERDIAYSNKIINDLLEYSRELKLELTESSPKLLLKEALTVVKVPRNIKIVDDTCDNLRIFVDIGRICRVLVNLIKNAFDAMPRGGTLTVSSRQIDDKVIFSFSDTGCGMSAEVLSKLWTPLFTTKAKGMGFGLPICKRIVEGHGGVINVESKLGRGTMFTVTIPIKPAKDEEKSVRVEGGEGIWIGVPESSLSTMTRA